MHRTPWVVMLIGVVMALTSCDDGDGGDGDADPDGAIETCRNHDDCNDGVDCTVDRCTDGACSHTADNALCGDGDPCNGDEICVLGQGCIDGEPLTCDDGIDCTDDECDAEATRMCTSTPNNDHCPTDYVCDPGVGGCTPAE